MDQPPQHDEEYFARKSHRCLSDGLFRRDFKEELGRCKPKTVDHLMSLANEWADGEDSIAAPRSRRRSAEHDIDAKDQFHSGS
jgi:hypothetical protein